MAADPELNTRLRRGVVALTVALVALFVWITRPTATSPTTTDSGTDGGVLTRWDWIEGQTVVDAVYGDRRIVETWAPSPEFDYEHLGIEQSWVSTPSRTRGHSDAVVPVVYAGTVLRSGPPDGGPPPAVYLYRVGKQSGDRNPVRDDGELAVFTEVLHGTGSLRTCLDAAGFVAVEEGAMLSGIAWGEPDSDRGEMIVIVAVPRQTAVLLLVLNDARSYVQRPRAGVGVLAITAPGDARPESLTAFGRDGDILAHQDLTDIENDATTSDYPAPGQCAELSSEPHPVPTTPGTVHQTIAPERE